LNKSQRDPWLLLPPVAFGALSAGYIVIAKGFTNQTSAAAPLLYGEAMAALSVLAFLVALAQRPSEPAKTGMLRPALLIHGLTAAAVAVVLLGGLYVGLPLFLFFFFWRIAQVPVLLSAAAALLFLGFIWFAFGTLLHLEIYQGYLTLFQN